MTAYLLILSLLLDPTASSADAAHLQDQAVKLASETDAAIAHGDYATAIKNAEAAFDIHERLHLQVDAAWDLGAVGLANQYLGRYTLALDAYTRALALARTAASREVELTQLNNIGTVYFLQGRYGDALASYQEALAKVDMQSSAPAAVRTKRMTLSNLAALNQRLGADERALDLYEQLRGTGKMLPAEEAQLLVNQGALARRLGDPIKAEALYRAAQTLFASAAHRDGEIGAWRNIGIVNALDLGDTERALDAFDRALKLSRGSSNRRGEVQALLYRGEALRRAGRGGDAQRDLRAALDLAVATGLVEEQWKAEYALGQLAEAAGDRVGARRLLEHAVAIIESVRADIGTPALRSEFLADKRDVYDALVWLRLHDDPVSIADVFRLFEQSRARTWRDLTRPDVDAPTLRAVQERLPDDTLLLEYWWGAGGSALMWAGRHAEGLRVRAAPDDELAIRQLATAVSHPGSEWRAAAIAVGRLLLPEPAVLGRSHQLLVVGDGPLHALPFETLAVPGGDALLVEKFDVSYLPSAAFLLPGRDQESRSWAWPWQRSVVAFGNSAGAAPSSLHAAPLPPLPFAEEEARRIARSVPGRAELHIGADARKAYVTSANLRTSQIVHFSAHAVSDTRDPDRSRLLLAPASENGSPDYLFLREVNDLKLAGVRLVTLSACDTERGKVVRGEGVEGFSRAFLAAGAASTVTTMWAVADRPSAELMKRFYDNVGRGLPLAASLRQAKLSFLGSQTAWAHPYFWAGYVLSGDGDERLRPVVSWSAFALAFLIAVAIVTVGLRAASKRPPRQHPHGP